MTDWIGRTLSKVQIERRLSRGGMAEVYLGRHITLNRPVAVKILHAHLQEDEDLSRRFLAEAQAVAQLRHPNIVQVFDFDVLDGRPYIVMELLQGMSLADYLDGLHGSGLSLPLTTICHITDGVAAALDYAHGQGIIHRDIKPGNVMLRRGQSPITTGLPLLPDVDPVLTDFGVARFTTRSTQTATGTVLGTPAYMSPEQIRGVDVDHRSDIYSLGIVVYELLSGTPPFNHDTTPAAVLVKHLQDPPPRLAGTHPAIQSVVNKVLAKEPADRHPRAEEFAKELRLASSTEPGTERTTYQEPLTATGLSPRLRIALWGLGGVLLLIVLGTAVVFGLRGPLAAEPAPSATAALSLPATPLPASATPAPTQAPAATTGPAVDVPSGEQVGTALLRDNSLTLQLDGVSEQPGFAYHVWLVPTDGEPLDLGVAGVSEGQLAFSYQAEESLIDSAHLVVVSLEPDPDPNPTTTGELLVVGELPQRTRQLVSLLSEVTGGGSLSELATTGLDRQSVHFTSHLGFALQAIEAGSLPGAKQHSEHVINIVEGRDGQDYGDWNGDGRIENPGDDFGLMSYLELLDVLLAGSPTAGGTDAADLLDQVETLTQITRTTRDLATRVAAADTLEETQLLQDELSQQELRTEVETLLASLESVELVLALPLHLNDG